MRKLIISALIALSIILIGTSCGSSDSYFEPTAQDKKVVMKIGDEKVEYQEFRYYFLNNKRDNYPDAEALTSEEIAELKALTEENAKSHAALLLLAREYGAELTDAQKEIVNKYVDDYRTGNFFDDESYRLALEAQYMTDYLFRELSSENLLAENIVKKMKETGNIATDDASIDAALADESLICIKEIYIAYNTEEMKEYSRAEAEEVLGKLMNGEAFEDLMKEHSDYSEASLPPEHGYYTTEYDALEEIWETAIGLAVGEYSRVVESDYGFHIVLRCEKDAEYMEENREALFEICAEREFWQEYEEFTEGLTVEYTSYGKTLELSEIK